MRSRFRLAAPRLGALLVFLPLASANIVSFGQNVNKALDRDGSTVIVEPYAPNILRVTLSLDKAQVTAAPGFGIIGTPSEAGWTHREEHGGEDVFRSARLVARLTPNHQKASEMPRAIPLDELNTSLRDHYFGGNANHRFEPHRNTLTISTADGKELLKMDRWSMVPNAAREHAAGDTGAGEGYRVAATFDSPSDEHYYGLGQHQQGFLDLRGHRMNCWHDYVAPGGETLCVPFVVSSRGYGLVWDNASKTTVDFGINGLNTWSSAVGDRVSFFVIAGNTTDEIYAGYRQLTGITHLLPKSTYGYIQSKAIYGTQEQIMSVAEGYRKRDIPADVLVVDFLNMTRQGEMDLDPEALAGPGGHER